MASKAKAFNLTKLQKLKAYKKEHPALPKANLTLAKPVLAVQFLKPNKTALKVCEREKEEEEEERRNMRVVAQEAWGVGRKRGGGWPPAGLLFFRPLSSLTRLFPLALSHTQMEIEHMIVKDAKTDY